MNKFTVITFSTLLISASSCSLFKKSTTTDDGFASYEPASTDSVSSSSAPIVLDKKSLDGEWTIINAYGTKVNFYTMPYLTFDSENNRIYGNNGCNYINGGFSVEENGSLKFGNMITTLAECNNKTEAQISKAIGNTTSFTITKEKGIQMLVLRDKKHNPIMTLRNHNLSLLNGTWTVTEIDGNAIDDENIRLVIDIPEGKLHGNSGCNLINGSISLDPKKKNAIQFSQIISTRKACPNMATETALLVALEEAEHFKAESSETIELLDNNRKCVLILKRIESKR